MKTPSPHSTISRRRLSALLAGFVFSFALAVPVHSFAAEKFERVVERVFVPAGDRRVELSVQSGDILFTAARTDSITVVTKMSVRAASEEGANAAFDRLKLDFSDEPDRVALNISTESSFPGSGFLSWIMGKRSQTPSVSVEVVLPENRLAVARSGSGDIKLRGVYQSLSAKSGSGDISGDDVVGSLEVAVGSGDIFFSGAFSAFSAAAGSGDIKIVSSASPVNNSSAASGSGDLVLQLPPDSNFSLEASSKSGSVSSDFVLTNPSTSSNQHLAGSVGSNGPSISLRSGSGDIRVHSLK